MAAKKTSTSTVNQFAKRAKRKRPGIHSKSKYSKLKGSKNYKKLNVGQG
jgi:ribosomal protein L44E